MALERLCFGTSTFVAGRLCPDKDSGPGMATLRAAILAGVRLIHSNPKLLTQWAIRRVVEETEAGAVRHLIKAEAPLSTDRAVVEAAVDAALDMSRERLGVDHVHAVVLEIDAKRSTADRLDDPVLARDFYQLGAQVVLATGRVERVLAYCHRPTQLVAALSGVQIDGIAAQYHSAAPWAVSYLADIADRGKIFIGMSPLARGALVNHSAAPDNRLAALRWAWADPRVSAVTITMSSLRHFHEVAVAVGHPQPEPCTPIDWSPARAQAQGEQK